MVQKIMVVSITIFTFFFLVGSMVASPSASKQESSSSSILLRDKKVITKDDASRVFDIIDKNRTGYVNIAQVRKVYG